MYKGGRDDTQSELNCIDSFRSIKTQSNKDTVIIAISCFRHHPVVGQQGSTTVPNWASAVDINTLTRQSVRMSLWETIKIRKEVYWICLSTLHVS